MRCSYVGSRLRSGGACCRLWSRAWNHQDDHKVDVEVTNSKPQSVASTRFVLPIDGTEAYRDSDGRTYFKRVNTNPLDVSHIKEKKHWT